MPTKVDPCSPAQEPGPDLQGSGQDHLGLFPGKTCLGGRQRSGGRQGPATGTANHRGVPHRPGEAFSHRRPPQLAAPYNPARKDQTLGQGFTGSMREFGSGKSHLLCCLAPCAGGRKEAWEIIRRKEEQAGRGKRESLYRSGKRDWRPSAPGARRGRWFVVPHLVGTGSGAVGISDRGRNWLGHPGGGQGTIATGDREELSLYPAEILATAVPASRTGNVTGRI